VAAPRKYDREFRERAVRMYRDRLAEGNDSKLGARRHVGMLLDLNPATLRNWVEDAERAGVPGPGPQRVVSAIARRCGR
jgi:transposase-like protein